MALPVPRGEAFLNAAEDGDVEELKKLLKQDPNLVQHKDDDGYTALHRASYEDYVDVVELLVESGAKVNMKTEDGWEPLHSAARWNCYNAVKALLRLGADINATTNGGQTPLHIAASLKAAKETVALLLSDSNINTKLKNRQGDTAETIAYRTGEHYELFKNKSKQDACKQSKKNENVKEVQEQAHSEDHLQDICDKTQNIRIHKSGHSSDLK